MDRLPLPERAVATELTPNPFLRPRNHRYLWPSLCVRNGGRNGGSVLVLFSFPRLFNSVLSPDVSVSTSLC